MYVKILIDKNPLLFDDQSKRLSFNTWRFLCLLIKNGFSAIILGLDETLKGQSGKDRKKKEKKLVDMVVNIDFRIPDVIKSNLNYGKVLKRLFQEKMELQQCRFKLDLKITTNFNTNSNELLSDNMRNADNVLSGKCP